MSKVIFAFATPPGRSGLAVLRISGDEALTVAARIFRRGRLPLSLQAPASGSAHDVDVAAGAGAVSAPKSALTPESALTLESALTPKSAYAPESVFTPPSAEIADLPGYRAVYGFVIHPTSGEVIDEAVLLCFRAPRSFTGEDMAEISVHGSGAVRRELIGACLAAGAEPAGPGEFSRRALLNGRLDLSQVEAVLDLIDSDSQQARRVALRQLAGQLSTRVKALRDSLIVLVARAELAGEYPEYAVGEDRFEWDDVAPELQNIYGQVQQLIDSYAAGRLIREGATVCLAGVPNAGKSALLNALVGIERSIVTDIPGTTRDTIDEWLHIADLAVRLTDTAGLRSVSDDDIENLGMERTRRTMAEADIVFWLLPADRPVNAAEIEPLRERANLQGVRVIPLISKSDLLTKQADLADFRRRWLDLWNAEFGELNEFGASVTSGGASAGETTACETTAGGTTVAGSADVGTTDFAGESEILACSAKTGAGLPELREALADLLGEMTRGGDTVDLISSERHLFSLKECREVLNELLAAGAGLPLDIITVLLNMAADALGEIIGATLSSDVLEHLFSNFCVGK